MIRIQLAAGRLAHRQPLSGSPVTGYKGTRTFSKTESVTLAVPSQLALLCLIPCLWPSPIARPALSKDNLRSHQLQTSSAAWHRILQSGRGSLGSLSASLCLLCMRSWICLALSDLHISSLGLEDLWWLASCLDHSFSGGLTSASGQPERESWSFPEIDKGGYELNLGWGNSWGDPLVVTSSSVS